MVKMSYLWKSILGLLLFSHTLFANTDDFKKLWYPGTIEEAFTQAKKDKKPMLLYWGAVWCPPCNELKAQIFMKPEFLAITEPVLRVYLDGDTEEAQKWGDKLHASGYPTLLLLSSQGKELFRLGNGVNWDEFKEAFQSALHSNGSFADALQEAQSSKKVPHSVWKILAYNDWYAYSAPVKEKAKFLLIREKLIDKIPNEFVAEKSLLVEGLLASASDRGDIKDSEVFGLWTRTDKKAVQYMNILLNSDQSAWAGRDLLTYGAKDLLKWLKEHSSEQEFKELSSRWMEHTEKMHSHKNASKELKLWSLYPQMILSKDYSKYSQKPFDSVKKTIIATVKETDENAKSTYERHSVISGAAWFLRELNEVEESRKLLLKELQETDTPWYYQSSLSHLEEKQGNVKEALRWSKLAKESAKGNATRFQWLASDLLLNLKLAPKDKKSIQALLKEYKTTKKSLSDANKGRNAHSIKAVEKALKKAGVK